MICELHHELQNDFFLNYILYVETKQKIKFRAMKVRTNFNSYKRISTYTSYVCYAREYVCIHTKKYLLINL